MLSAIRTYWPAIILVLLVVAAWLSMGRRLAECLDRLVTARAQSLPASPIEYDGGGLVIGEQSMTFGQSNNLRADLELVTDFPNRVVLCARQSRFILGPRTNPVDSSGRPEISFVPERGDELSFVSRASLLPWRAPFEFPVFGGPSPRWDRYVFYTLVWKKSSGARLEMSWRYEMQYYAERGWTRPVMRWNSHTGLLSVRIQ